MIDGRVGPLTGKRRGSCILPQQRKKSRTESIPWSVPCRLALTLGTIALCAGCGKLSDKSTVTGTMTLTNGSTLVNARVIARSDDAGKTVYSYTDGEGRYWLSDSTEIRGSIPPGHYRVRILEDVGDMENRKPPTIASKYRSASTSGIKFSVEAGEKLELNLELEPVN